jgi:hypothetical protein
MRRGKTRALGRTDMDPSARLQRGQEAAAAGRYEDALRDYIWFHEHALEHEPSLYGVRLSFALWYWIELANEYPEARIALKRVRDEKTARLLNGDTNRDLFHDVESINDRLENEEATYELFATLEKAKPDFAAVCADLAMPAIVKAEDFAMALRYTPSPGDTLSSYSEALNRDIEELERQPPSKAPRLEAYVQIYVRRVYLLLKILRGNNQNSEADALRVRALELVKSPSARDAVREGLQSAA